MISVCVVDDQTLLRQGLCSLLACLPDVQVVGEAQDGEEALTVIAPTDYDVAVVRLADVDGARAVPALLTCRIPTVLLVSSFRGNLPDQVANRPTIAVVVEPWHHTEITLAIAHARGIQRRATT